MQKRKWYFKKRWWVLVGLLTIYSTTFIYHQFKSLPEGISYVGEAHPVSEDQIDFLYDLTYQTEEGEVYEHEIFEAILNLIENAEHFLIIDMFMINTFSSEGRDFPQLTRDFITAIEEQVQNHPDLKVVLITDLINQSYGSHEADIDSLTDLGVEVIYADLEPLRDPNPIFSSAYRMFFQWFGYESDGWLPNVFGPEAPDMSIRSYLKLLNAKANHRKAVISENEGIVTSLNVHDASGFHSNIAFRVRGEIIPDLIDSERAVADYSGGDLDAFPTRQEIERAISTSQEEPATIQAQYITEQKIEDATVKVLQASSEGDEIWLGMFYLSDRNVIEALTDAANRGAKIRIIFDPNENAFGQEKIGMPNIPVAAELLNRTDDQIEIRWYNVYEEQYHTKMMLVKRGDIANIIGGSTNFTTRNLNNFNLENNLNIVASSDSELVYDIEQYFYRLWENEDAVYTLDYEAYADSLSTARYLLYLLQKYTRITTY